MRVVMSMRDFSKHIEEEIDEIARELGFNPQGQALESKVQLINEKLSVFGFREQALEYIKGYVDLLQKRTRYSDMLRLGSWTYLMMDEFRRTHTIKVTSFVRRWAPEAFRFLSDDGRQISPRQWLIDWSGRFPSKKYPETVYEYLVRQGPNIDRFDVLIMGWWKDSALDLASVPLDPGVQGIDPKQLKPNHTRWRPEPAGVAYDGWNWLANNLSAMKCVWSNGNEVPRFLECLSSLPGSHGRFGLPRATFVLHVLSRGDLPIYDKNTHNGLYLLTDQRSHARRIPATKQQDPDWYLHVFCPLIAELRMACESNNSRLIDRALFTYGRGRRLTANLASGPVGPSESAIQRDESIGPKQACPTERLRMKPDGGSTPIQQGKEPIKDSATFWEALRALRIRKVISKQWRVRNIRPHLIGQFSADTITTMPPNQSISKDSAVKGNHVVNGARPMAYRVERGLYELIDDPS